MKNLNVINKNNPVPAEGYFDLPVLDDNGNTIINANNEIETRRFVINGKPVTPATASTLGGIKVGDNLSIDENGVLSVSIDSSNDSSDIISIPVIVSSDIGIINQTFQFQVSARSATNATITQFKCNLTNCDEQIVNAQDNDAQVTFTIPDGEDNDTLTFTCVAYDSNNNSSAEASKTITVKKVGIVVPNVTVNTENNYVSERPTITITNTFAVYGNEGTTFSDTLDHIVYTVKENDTIIWTKNSTDYNITLDSDLLENKEYTFEAQFVGTQLSSPVGKIVKNTPVAFYIIDTPIVTLNANSRGLPEELIITSSQYKCRTFANALTTNETHSSTTWTLFENDIQVWQSANDVTNLTSITCGYVLKTSKTYRVSVVYNGSRGHSSSAGDAIGTTPDVFAIVNPTTVTVDYNDNNDYYCGLDLVVHTTEFSAVNDTHASTDWKICSDENGENILASVLDSRDLTSHTFNAALMSTIGSGTVYVFARHQGIITGYSAPWSKIAITLKAPVVETPSILSPSDNASQYYGQSMSVTMSAYNVTGGNETESTGNWKICSDSAGSSSLVSGTFSAGTSFTISIDDLTTAGAGIRYLFVQKKDSSYGLSSWSTGTAIVIKQPTLSTPSISSPSADTSYTQGTGSMTVSWGSVTKTGGSGTVTYTVKICSSNSSDTSALKSKTTTSTSVTFSASDTNDISAGTKYIFVQASWTYGTSSWSSSMNINIISKDPAIRAKLTEYGISSASSLPGHSSSSISDIILSEHGRLLYRHSNNKGSVVVFDMFGTTMKMFVADAAYRTSKQFGTYDKDSSLANFTDDNEYINNDGYFNPETAINFTLNDSTLQSYFSSFSTDLTARANCDVWMTYQGTTDTTPKWVGAITGVPAVEYCRSLTSFTGINNGCDLPNIYELNIIWIESDNLDSLDPTGSSNTGKLLGYTNPSGRFSGDLTGYVWSSTEYGSNNVRCVYDYGRCNDYGKFHTYGVVPIREL